MGVLDKLFGRSKVKKNEDAAVPQVACPHVALAPRWDSTADIGHEDKAISFICDACHESFTPAEARALRGSEAQRLKQELDLDPTKE